MPADPAPAARRYRDVTKHTPASVRSDRFGLDWTNKPALYRSYPGAETVALPGTRTLTRPAVDAIAQAPAAATSAAPLDLDLLGAILFLTGGVTRARPSGGDIRAPAAAGALYPNELYVVTGNLPALAAGIYHYEPREQRLSRLRDGDWRGVLAEAADDPEVRRTAILAPGVSSRSRAPSRSTTTGALSPSTSISSSSVAAIVNVRLKRPCGARGVTRIASTTGETIGPPTESV